MKPLSFVVAVALASRAGAQSVDECVSSPGVNLGLLTACEQLQTQLSKQLTAGGTVDLSTQISYQLSPTTDSSGASITLTSFLQTSAIATSNAANGGLGGGSSNGQGGASTSVSGGSSGSGANSPIMTNGVAPTAGTVSGVARTGSIASGSLTNQPLSTDTASGGAATASGSTTAGQANAQSTSGPSLTQSSSNSDPHHYRNTVVIPVAVVCSIVPLLLLALLACWLIRRRRKSKSKDTAASGFAFFTPDEKHESWNKAPGVAGTSQSRATGSAAPENPFTNAAATGNGVGQSTPAATAAQPGVHSGASTAAGLGTGAAVGAGGAGVAGLAAHHSKQSSETPSMTSAYSQSNNNLHGLSGDRAPAQSAPLSTSQASQSVPPAHHAPGVGPAVGAGVVGGGVLAGLDSQSNQSREHQPPPTASSAKSERPPTLPEMDPTIGSGTWLAGEYDDPINRNSLPRDSAGHTIRDSADYGVPHEDVSDRYGSGVPSNRSTNYSRPSVPSSPGHGRATSDPATVAARNDRFDDVYAAAEDPFTTPPTSIRASREQIPVPSPARPLQHTPVPKSTSPVSALEGSKAAQIFGLESSSGSVTPVQSSSMPTQQRSAEQMAPTQTQPASAGVSSSWMPSAAVGEIRQGPYSGPTYHGPNTGLDGEQTQAGLQQVTSYPSENEARAFDFSSGRRSGDRR